MNTLSLRTKGLIIIIVISLVPLLIVGLFNYTSVKNDMIETELDNIRLKQDSRSLFLQSWLDIRKSEVLVMSRTNEVRSGNTAAMKGYLERERALNEFQYSEIGFVTQDGIITSLTGKKSTLKEQLPIARSLRGDIVLTDPVSTGAEERLGYISVPVYSMDESNELIGALFAAYAFPPAAYSEKLQIEEGNLYLYNHSGQLIYDHIHTVFSNQQDIVLRNHLKELAGLALIDPVGNKEVSVSLQDYIIFYQKIGGTNWVIMEVKDLGSINKLAAPTLWRMLLVVALAIGLIAVVFYLYFQSIITRLKAILQVTKRAAAGNFDGDHLNASTQDEIGNLAKTVNGMMRRLQLMFDRLDAVINQNKNPVFVMDERYYITYLNKAAEEMIGYTSEELVGKATPLIFMDMDEVNELAEKFSQEIGREVQPGVELFIELRKHYPNYEYELTILHRDGRRTPVFNRSSSLKDRSGRYSGIIALLTDLSEQRQLETDNNRLQMVVASAKDLIASVDQNSNIIFINQAGRDILGLGEEELRGLSLKSLLPEHMYKLLLRGAIIARRQGFFECEAQFQNIAGKFINVSIIIVTYEDSMTGETMFSCISRDITEQLEVQRKLVHATEVAEEANKAKSNFLALMSHEIRTPLNGIIGLSQLLQKTDLDHVQHDYVQHMKDSSSMLLNIVNDILDFSKLEAKKIEPDLSTFQMHVLINHLADQLNVFLGGKEQFEFKIEIDEHVPHSVIGDALRLEQVLSNLCVNAVKFTEHGLVELTITVAADRDDEIDLQFLVRDTGIGMSEQQLKYIFKPFTQADSSTTRKYGGTGLGLVISRNLVELLGGELHAESKLHEGSAFTFTLPFKKVAYQYTPEPIRQKQQSVKVESVAWIIEDHELMANYWSQQLAGCGYNAVKKRSWKKAYLRLMRLGEGAYPAFIIVDMEMNDMYGMDTWLEFQEAAAERNIPIIAITTAYGREELLLLEPELQPQAILTKPVTQKRFQDAIDHVLYEKTKSRQAPKHESELKQNLTSNKAAELIELDEPQLQVLLAEDNKINQLVAAEMLKHCNCKVTIANDGLEAIQQIEKQSYDLVLMDIHMPQMDGLEATRYIRSQEQYRELPIVAVTANVLASDHEQYVLQGMNAVITKPITLQQLEQIIQQYTQKQASQQSKQNAQPVLANEELLVKLESLSSIDAKTAIERVNGKINIYMHMLEQFLDDYSFFISKLKQYYESNDYDEITRALHTLKGASSYLGAHHIVSLTVEGKRILREKQSSMLPTYINELESALNAALYEISTTLEHP
ncbi:response regulator [Paenibacillus sp. FSL W7-1287]|uniref:response regulator n=1 Tax=Paenibacillus sp. FSL W7-1287 TaxID=2954538 RepID=UPI0030F6681E